MIAAANMVVGAAEVHPRTLYGPDVMAVAQRFAESGQLINYMRASELSQEVITSYFGLVPEVMVAPRRKLVSRRQLRELMRLLWSRVPLLVLMAGWFVLGVGGGFVSLLAREADAVSVSTVATGFEMWGVGFLVLVVIQFFVTLRNVRFRN
jgi:hypothetical protein